MNCWMKQHINGEHKRLIMAEDLCKDIGIWSPVIVARAEEKDYLEGLCLMMGKNYHGMILLDGVDESKLEFPPTWVSIPHLT